MTVEEIISHAHASGISLEVDDGNLKVRGKNSALIPEFVGILRDNKDGLVKFISERRLPRIWAASAGQRRIWLAGSQSGNKGIFNITICCEIPININIESLETAFELLVRRHEILRTGLDLIDGELKQIIYPFEDIKIALFDKRPKTKSLKLETFLKADAQHQFDLKRPPLFIANLYSPTDDETILSLVFHHSIVDAWSIPIFLKELVTLYFFRDAPLPLLKIQYRDYVEWMEKVTRSSAFVLAKEYWQKQFSDGVPVLNMPLDFERGKVKSNQGKFASKFIDSQTYSSWKKAIGSKGITPFVGAISLVYVLLHKYTKSNDIVVGTAVGGRPDLSFNDLIGFFVNTLPLRVSVDDRFTLTELFRNVKEAVLGALTNNIYPFDKIVEDLNRPYSLNRHALYDVVVVFQNEEATSLALSHEYLGKKISLADVPFRSVTTDLRIEFNEYEGGLQLNIDYDTSLFKEKRIEFILCHLERLINNFSSDLLETRIGSLEILSEDEKKILNDLSSIDPESFVNGTLTEAFERSLKRNPTSISIFSDETSLTYAELNGQVEKLALYLLTKHKVTKNTVVAVFIPGTAHSIISMLAIWKCGAVYLPIDVGMPEKRLSYIFEDSDTAVIITDSIHFFSLSDLQVPLIAIDLELPHLVNPDFKTWPDIYPEDIAYLIYTSGSTGVPKGVMVHHSGCLNMSLNQIKIFDIDPKEDRIALFASISFDASISEILMALLCGASIVVVPEEMKRNGVRLFSFLKCNRVTVITLPPSYLRVIDKNNLAFLNRLILAGEALHKNDVLDIPRHIRVFNAYGPTETSVCATIHEIKLDYVESERVPIGKPLKNIGILICDEDFSPVPIGIPGHICVIGEGVSKGYRNNITLTEKYFKQSIFQTSVYLTGDLGVINIEGNIEYIGRRDDQLKVNGFRIEPDEIVKALNQHPQIEHSAIIYSESTKELVAFFTCNDEVFIDDLKDFLGQSLPHYMVPEVFVKKDQLPLTSSGKVDKNILRADFIAMISSTVNEAVLLAPEELELAGIWQKVLGKQVSSSVAHFFDLGGDSIKAIQLTTLVNKSFHVEMDITELFAHPNFSDFHSAVLAKTKSSKKNIIKLSLQDYYRLSEGQSRLWALSQIDSIKYAYNLPSAYRISGDFDFQVFTDALRQLIERHEVLRTEIVMIEGNPYQRVVNTSVLDFKIVQVDLSGSTEKKDIRIKQIVEQEVAHVFDLEKAPLWRICLIKVDQNNAVLSINMHHLIADAWSFEIFIKEFLIIYNSLLSHSENELSPLPFTYKDVVEFRLNDQGGLEVSRDYWLRKFIDLPLPVSLKYDFPRPATKSYHGGYCSFKLNPNLFSGLRKLALDRSMSLYPLLVSSVNLLLYSYSLQEDMVIGMPFSGRDIAEVQPMMGFFVNTIPLRTQIKKNWTVDHFITGINEEYLRAYQYQEYGFYQLIKDLNLKRDPSRYPLFDVWVVLQNPEIKKENFNLPFDVQQINFAFDICKYDLKFDFVINDHDGEIFISYSGDLFVKSSIDRMCDELLSILTEFITDPLQSIESVQSKLMILNSRLPDNKKIKKR